MRKGIGALVALQLGLIASLAGQGKALTDLFPPKPTGYVNDVAHLLDAGMAGSIEARLTHLRDVTGGEVTVVTLPTIGDYGPEQVAVAIGRAWGVGANGAIGDARRNTGVVILVVPRTADHKGEVFIAPGIGAEGFLTDAKAGQIRDAMLPALRSGDYNSALDVGSKTVAALIADNLGIKDTAFSKPKPVSRNDGGRIPFRFIAYLVLLVIFLIINAVNRRGGGGKGGGGGNSWLVPFLIGQAMGGSRGGWGGGGGFGGGGGGGGGFGGFGGGGGFSGGGAGGSF